MSMPNELALKLMAQVKALDYLVFILLGENMFTMPAGDRQSYVKTLLAHIDEAFADKSDPLAEPAREEARRLIHAAYRVADARKTTRH